MDKEQFEEQIRNYEEDRLVNPDALDLEWLRQSNLFGHYADLSAKANRRAKEAEENVKVIRSILSKEANENPDEVLGKGVKPTATNVEAYYRTHPDHKKAKEEWIQATYEAEMLSNAVFAFHQKKASLEYLVILHGQNYFASPKEPRELNRTWRDRVKETDDNQRTSTRENIRGSLGKSPRGRTK